MGSSISVCIAKIAMLHVEKLNINQFNDKNLFSRCYVHDIFVLTYAHYMKDILEHVNSFCSSLQFTGLKPFRVFYKNKIKKFAPDKSYGLSTRLFLS